MIDSDGAATAQPQFHRMAFLLESSLFISFYYFSGYFGGTIDYESEPFCGRASLKNMARIIDGVSVDITSGRYVCAGNSTIV